MTGVDAIVSHLLAPADREAVLGDLAESGETAWQSLLQIAGLALRRHIELWRTYRPWLAALGLSLPASLALMGVSVSATWAGRHLLASPQHSISSLLSQSLLLLLGSWSAGYAAGSISRPTLWASAVLCCSPCLYCFSRFHIPSLPSLSLLLFLPPAVLGVRHGMRNLRLPPVPAIAIAAAVTLLSLPALASGRLWFLNLALIWPVWYLVRNASIHSGTLTTYQRPKP